MSKNFSHLEFSSMFMHIKIIKVTAEMQRLIRLSKNLHKFICDLTQEESSSHETAWQSQWVSGFSRNDSDSCWLKKVKDTLLKHSSWLDLSLYVVEISRCSVWGYSFRFSQPDIVFSKALLNRLYRSWRRFRRERRFLLTIVNLPQATWNYCHWFMEMVPDTTIILRKCFAQIFLALLTVVTVHASK